MAPATKEQIIKAAIDKLEKDFGKGSVIKVKDAPHLEVEAVSTGSLGIDAATGIGGLPRGRIVEIYGPESSGKTTLATHVVAEAQKAGGTCAIVDAEHALDFEYAQKIGVNTDDLYLSQPDYGEQALEITRRLVETGQFDVIVVDSVAALTPKSEIEGEIGDATVGKQARMMSQALRILTAKVHQTQTLVIFINQLREKIGVMQGSPETTTGGNALKFYASMRIDIRRDWKGGFVKNADEEVIATNVVVKIVKNKLAAPFKVARVELRFNVGFNRPKEILRVACDLNIVKKSGSWFSYNETKLGQGEDNVVELLKDNPELMAEVAQKVFNYVTPAVLVENTTPHE